MACFTATEMLNQIQCRNNSPQKEHRLLYKWYCQNAWQVSRLVSLNSVRIHPRKENKKSNLNWRLTENKLKINSKKRIIISDSLNKKKEAIINKYFQLNSYAKEKWDLDLTFLDWSRLIRNLKHLNYYCQNFK